MNATLYLPQQPPQVISADGFALPDSATGFVRIPEQVPALLGCTPGLVDVLACGPQYVAYSVFDCEDAVNSAAMQVMTSVCGVAFDPDDEDAVLCGAVLVLTQ